MAKKGEGSGVHRRPGTDSIRRDGKRPAGEARQRASGEHPTIQHHGSGDDRHARRGSDVHTRKGGHTTPEQIAAGTDSVHRRRKTMFRGIPVVPGIAIGPARIKFRRTQVLADRPITPGEVVREEERLAEAVRQSKEQLLEARAKVARDIGEVEAMIFDAHIAILEDQSFLRKVRAQVAKDLKPVEVVVAASVENYYRAMAQVKDVHMRERAADIRDVGRRLLDNLEKLSRPANKKQSTEQEGSADEIICARELLPSDLVALEHRRCQAIICELGSDRGHAAIMLRAMGMPSVMGLDGIFESLEDGDDIIVDGSTGTVYINPKKDVVDSYRKTQQEFEGYKKLLNAEVELPAVTTDGHTVRLLANVSKHSEIDLAKLYNADGVGLYRSEFHLMVGSTYPDEEEQYWIYREAVERMGDRKSVV